MKTNGQWAGGIRKTGGTQRADMSSTDPERGLLPQSVEASPRSVTSCKPRPHHATAAVVGSRAAWQPGSISRAQNWLRGYATGNASTYLSSGIGVGRNGQCGGSFEPSPTQAHAAARIEQLALPSLALNSFLAVNARQPPCSNTNDACTQFIFFWLSMRGNRQTRTRRPAVLGLGR